MKITRVAPATLGQKESWRLSYGFGGPGPVPAHVAVYSSDQLLECIAAAKGTVTVAHHPAVPPTDAHYSIELSESEMRDIQMACAAHPFKGTATVRVARELMAAILATD